MKRFVWSIAGCLLMYGMLYAPLYAQTIQRQNLAQVHRFPVPPPPESKSDDARADGGKIYQCTDKGKFYESSATLVAADEIFSKKNVSSGAQITSKPPSTFTERARRNGTSGTVRLKLILTADGRIADVKIIRGLPDGLTENSISAACRIRFTPALKDDRPVSQSVIVEYGFYLTGRAPFPFP